MGCGKLCEGAGKAAERQGNTGDQGRGSLQEIPGVRLAVGTGLGVKLQMEKIGKVLGPVRDHRE